MSEKPIKIIGLGNYLYSDEGQGIHVIEPLATIFANDEIVEVIEGSTDGIKLLDPVEKAEKLLVVDAIKAGEEPGTIIQLEGEEIPKYFSTKLSVHQLGFHEVLMAADLRGRLPEKIIIIGIQPESLEFGTMLSETVKQNFPKLIEKVLTIVHDWKKDYDVLANMAINNETTL